MANSGSLHWPSSSVQQASMTSRPRDEDLDCSNITRRASDSSGILHLPMAQAFPENSKDPRQFPGIRFLDGGHVVHGKDNDAL